MREDLITDKKHCEVCGEILTYKGLGEYYCPFCEKTAWDDYGKVRNYLESHVGATVADVSDATKVSRSVIRRFIEQDRFIENTSRAFKE